MTDLGERFAKAFAAKDADALLDVLTPAVDVKAMTPGRIWEPITARELVHDVILGVWFEPDDRIDALERVEHGDPVVDTQRVGYRLRVTNPHGEWLVEQQVYYRTRDDRIEWLRIMCSGYRKVRAPE
jgi:hypothetical protein